AREVQDYSSTINNFKQSSDVAPFFDSAYGYAVFPTIGKGGLGIGAAHGKGQVYAGGKVTGFSSLSDISIGFQAGGQAYSQVVFFEDERAFSDFTSGNFEFGAQASAIAVQASASAEAGSEGAQAGASSGGSGGSMASTKYYKGMLVFTIGKGGLMYEATISGQKYTYDPLN
ncbi:MAG: lipid-binding SYLF domain-containing protein, partial [Thermoanaerobaculia bacterium]